MAKPTSLPNRTIVLPQALINEIIEHARAESPAECCGLVGGADEGRAQAVYRLRNIASDHLVGYEAAPEDLFAAQREMRARGEELLAIYHSHPRANDPSPSETDVRLAYYPAAIYLIIGLGSTTPVMRAFRISEREQHWQEVEYEIVGE
ncbi:MAG: M67 family metallopeptidase [Pyrinomonadaceae bacterium]